ncbi:MAG: hypothetical protein Q8L87_19260, partial [Anaerolineales bacterium]|nr:hypothetical protein [Anaerolineales bacterium]
AFETRRPKQRGISIDVFFSAHHALLKAARKTPSETASFEASLADLKDKLASMTSVNPAETELPYNCTMIYPWLFGSAFPDSRQQIDTSVELLGIRAIVTLTPCPLTSPRIFHCSLDESGDDPFFFDPPGDMLEGVKQRPDVTLHHIPIVDAGTPSKDQAQEFLRICEETREKNGAVLVHCWGGSRRTFCMLKLAVMHFNRRDHPLSLFATHFKQNDFVGEMFASWPRMSPAREIMMLIYLLASLYRPLDAFKKGNPPAIFTQPQIPPSDPANDSLGTSLQEKWLDLCNEIITTACNGNVELAQKVFELYEAHKEQDWPAIFISRGYPSPSFYRPSCYPDDPGCVSERCLLSFLTNHSEILQPYLKIQRWKSSGSRFEWGESRAQRQRKE